ncbi:MAG: hypothetical protein SVK08_01660 [Halobacteriota archaeon]|nr:hypothetical protein [Halobacteriota archaeon]
MERKSIPLSVAKAKERLRKETYKLNGTPYQPRIYHITGENAEYPKKTERDPNFKHGYMYDTNHWMIGNIIRNPHLYYKNKRRQMRNHAIWYSIDGRTSHSMTKEAFDSIAPMLEQFEIKPPVGKKKYFEINNLKNEETVILVHTAGTSLSHLCERAKEPCSEVFEHEEAIRHFLERSVVQLIRSPRELYKLINHILLNSGCDTEHNISFSGAEIKIRLPNL